MNSDYWIGMTVSELDFRGHYQIRYILIQYNEQHTLQHLLQIINHMNHSEPKSKNLYRWQTLHANLAVAVLTKKKKP